MKPNNIGNHLVVTTVEIPISPNSPPQPTRLVFANPNRVALVLSTPNTANDCAWLLFGQSGQEATLGAHLFTKQVVPITLDYSGELWVYSQPSPFGTIPDNTFAILHVTEIIGTAQ